MPHNPTDHSRYDGRDDLICCSIEYPNSYYFANVRNNDRLFKDWVVLTIKPEYLWHPDTWIIMYNGERRVILMFSKTRIKQTLAHAMTGGTIDFRNASWRNLEGGVEANIKSGACIGHSALFIPEKLIKPYMKTRKLPANFWTDVVAENYGHTSSIVEVYQQIH